MGEEGWEESKMECGREKKGSGGGGGRGGWGRREEMHGRGKVSYAREQDLRELRRAERSRVILHNDG